MQNNIVHSFGNYAILNNFSLSVEALTFPPSSGKSFIMGADEALESELGLGELAGLTVANEADSLTYDVSYYSQCAVFHSVFKELYVLSSKICDR